MKIKQHWFTLNENWMIKILSDEARITFYIDRESKRLLKEIAKDRDLNLSQLLRLHAKELVTQYKEVNKVK